MSSSALFEFDPDWDLSKTSPPEREVVALYKGVTTPVRDLYADITARGYEPKVEIKGGQYVATASSPTDTVTASGPTDATALGNVLLKIIRTQTVRNRYGYRFKRSAWDSGEAWVDMLPEIAQAYRDAPIYDPKAAPAWKELAQDSMARFEQIRQQIDVEIVDEPEPYATAQEMCEDVHNGHFKVSRANSNHPVWSVMENVAFRAVHDVLAHCRSGGGFDWAGECEASAVHMSMLPPLAQKAVFTEAVGQTGYAAFYRSFPPQKVAFLDELVEQAQEENNPANWQGIHPSQVLVPSSMPELPQGPHPQFNPEHYVAPHQEGLGLTPVMTKKAAYPPSDPNAEWTPGIDPLPRNAYLWHDDPLDMPATKDNAMRLDTNWSDLDRSEIKQAVVNSLRTVLLSPQKNLRWNAIHYQDIRDIPPDVSDPKRYWDRLEERRKSWNTARGYTEDVHRAYFKEWLNFRKYIHAQHPELSLKESDALAEKEMFGMRLEEEQRILADPKNQKKDVEELSRKVDDALAKRLKMMLRPNVNEETDYGERQLMFHEGHYEPDPDAPPAGEFIMDTEETPFGITEVATGWRQAHDELVLEALHGWKGWPSTMRTFMQADRDNEPTPQDGNGKKWRMQAAALRWELNNRGRPNDKPLYRGASYDSNGPSAWTENRTVAEHWAGKDGEGQVHEAPPGTLKGIRIEDYGITDMDEKEWIAFDPNAGKTAAKQPGFKQMDVWGNEAGRYAPWFGSHLQAIAEVGKHADELTDAAIKDMEEGGKGYHFRSALLNLNLKGVGPKVASFAWLLLAPTTSELATIDTHMMEILDHDIDKDMNNRDYFRYERELNAARDAMGYESLPLGQFQWAMWDLKRSGLGQHQDHSALRPLDPTPYSEVNWEDLAPKQRDQKWKDIAPEWWHETQEVRDQVARSWEEEVAPHFPKKRIPRLG